MNISMSLKIRETLARSAKEAARKDTLINTCIISISRNLGHMRKRNTVLYETTIE